MCLSVDSFSSDFPIVLSKFYLSFKPFLSSFRVTFQSFCAKRRFTFFYFLIIKDTQNINEKFLSNKAGVFKAYISIISDNQMV